MENKAKRSYMDWVESTRLIKEFDSCTSTGDADYPGSVLEVEDSKGNQIFFVVVDRNGERQFMFFASREHYRIPLRILDEVIAFYKKSGAYSPDDPGEE